MDSNDDFDFDLNSENLPVSSDGNFANSQTFPAEINESQDTYCEVMSQRTDLDGIMQQREACSQSIFSQDTEYELPDSQHSVSTDVLSTSNEVEVVCKPVSLVILETESDSTNEKNSAITISESSENKMVQVPSNRRKSSDHSPTPSKKSCLTTDNIDVGSSTSLEMTPLIMDRGNVTSRSTPHSPRKKRSGSCDICCNELSPKPARRLKRSLSSDIERIGPKKLNSRFSPSDFKKMAKILETDTTFDKRKTVQSEISSPVTIVKEQSHSGESRSFGGGDSQSIKLYLSPSTYEIDSSKDEELQSREIIHLSEDSKCKSSNEDGFLSESNQSSGELSNGNVQKLSSSGGTTDQDSTASVELDSPYNIDLPTNLNLKSKPYLSNGYSSSTPENGPFTEGSLLKKSFHISDSEGDNTPPFVDYNKPPDGLSKLSNNSKSDLSIRNNSSNSSLNNGHSNGSHYSNGGHSNVPSFNVQMCMDDNNDFLSMFIVKTDSALGNHTLKEYQRVSRRLTIDPYGGDASKSTSPSSVTSGGLLQLPPHPRSSFTSITSSSSSSRTSDGAFVIPQLPRKTLSFHTHPTSVKGLQTLKQKVNEIITCLDEVYGDDDAQSPTEISCSNNISREINKKSPEKTENDCNRTTPKSSKKKVQTKTKRVLSGKIKKSDLSITNEEPNEFEGINSPEMIPTDPDKCQSSLTPFRMEKHINSEENGSSPKTIPRIRKLKSSSPAVSTGSTDSNVPVLVPDEAQYSEGNLVLAKWVDKRYYSGKVKQVLDSNKYLIQFDDGHSKTLLDDFIIFGNMTELPLVGQSIYAMVDNQQNYEPSLVMAVDKTEAGNISYKCTTDGNNMVLVAASEIYLTEDQAKSFKESNPPKSPHSAPGTPRRRVNRELDLDNIIQGPRSARLRDKGNTPKGVTSSPSSPKASTSLGGRGRGSRRVGGTPKRRQESESSEGGDSRASSGALEEVAGVQPEVQKTPRKIHGIRAVDLPIKGASKQMIGKRSSKVTKFECDHDTVMKLGPIPPEGSIFFSGLHFLLTCTDLPRSRENKQASPKNWSDSEQCTESSPSTEKDEDNMLVNIPFQKERLKEQLERAGGTVYSHFEDIPKSKYGVCKLIVPRPCLTAKYIQCLGANIKALSYLWVINSCLKNKLMDQSEFTLPTGWSFERNRYIRWKISSFERGSATPFKDKLILLCSDNDNFTKFWERVCSLAGANTRILTEENMELGNGVAVVTECDCPHEIQNKASLESIPLVSTSWVVQCLIEGKLLSFQGSQKYNFAYNEAD